MDKESKIKAILKGIVSKLITVAVVALLVVLYVTFASDKKGTKDNYGTKLDLTKYVEATAAQKAEYAGIMLDDHRLIAKSDTHELYLKDDTLSIKVKDLKTGEVMDSTIADPKVDYQSWKGYLQSGVVVTLLKRLDYVQVDMVNSENDITITDLTNGFKAQVELTPYGVEFTMYVTLEENDVCVAIPNNSIKEYGTEYLVSDISVYPTMGATHLGEVEGYMLIPDGSGALISLEDKEGKFTGGYTKYIYGLDDGFDNETNVTLLWDEIDMVSDSENILAPIYGMVHTDRQMGYIAIIKEGDKRATISAIPNGAFTNYNRIYSKFIYNTTYVEYTSQDKQGGSYERVETQRTQMDIDMCFSFVSGDKANYTGLAIEYREYLLDNDMINTDADISYNTRIDFLGTERENWLTTTTAVPMTTVENIRKIFDELKDANVTDILSVYKGWQDGGIQDVPIQNMNADSSIGGTGELVKLVDELKGTDIDFYLYQDAVKFNPAETNSTFNVMKMTNKRVFEQSVYMDVYKTFNLLIPQRSVEILKGMTSKYTDKGIENVALAGISNKLYSHFDSGVHYTRQDTADMFEKAVANTDKYMNTTLEQPFAYLWKYTNAFLDMPVASSNYIYESEQVPFLSIALKGIVPMYSEYVNFEANKQQFFLKLVETGIFPSFYITHEDSADLIYTNSADVYSSKYSVYKQEIIDYAGTLSAFNAKVEGAMISNHEILDSGAVVVTYDNGVKVYINYTDHELVIDDITVGAMEFMIGGEGNE